MPAWQHAPLLNWQSSADMRELILLLIYLFAANLTAFFLMRWDKTLSKTPCARRIPENVLFLSAMIGGSIGAILGMQVFRHKTKHWYFSLGMPAILIAQLTAAAWLYFSE